MIIDAHTHGLHGKHIEQLIKAGGEWAKKGISSLVERTQRKPHFVDLTMRIEMLDRNKIDLQVVTPPHGIDCNLLPGDAAAQHSMAMAMNDHMARIMEDSKGRLIAAGNVPLGNFDNGGKKEMARAIKTLGLKAISIPSNLMGKAPDLPEFESFWAQAEEMDVPVYIHPNDPAGNNDRRYEAEYDLIHNFGWPFETTLIFSRLVFSGIMERYSRLKIISHHLGGGMIPFFIGRINETYSPERQQKTIGKVLPKPLFDYFSMFYYDTAVGGSAAAIRCAYEVFGANRLLFATDAPWGPGTGELRLAEYPKAIYSLNLRDEDTRKILADNASQALKLT